MNTPTTFSDNEEELPARHKAPQSTSERHADKKRKEGLRSIFSTVVVLISAPIIALLLIAFVFQSYEVDGPSMQNTLENQDRLIVIKAGKTWAQLTGQEYIPDRGDIVVFAKRGTVDPSAGGERQLIKRVIGLPGDRVLVRSGVITIFNDDRPDGFDPDSEGDYQETIASRGGASDIDISVPEGHIFVIGDNRSNSLDSRTFGIISSDEIIGKLALRIYPLNEITRF